MFGGGAKRCCASALVSGHNESARMRRIIEKSEVNMPITAAFHQLDFERPSIRHANSRVHQEENIRRIGGVAQVRSAALVVQRGGRVARGALVGRARVISYDKRLPIEFAYAVHEHPELVVAEVQVVKLGRREVLKRRGL